MTIDPAEPTRAWTAVRAGNTYDKYASRNPIARRLTAGFLAALDALAERAAAAELLDVGCGEGLVTERLSRRPGVTRAVGLDRASARLRPEWDARAGGRLRFMTGNAHALPFAADAFDLACAIEVLEQVDDPPAVLAELVRVARRHVLVSVPREPIWRILNVARGAYLHSAGNPPGHLHHFSRRAFVQLCAAAAPMEAVATPFPWTIVLLRV